MDGFKVERKSSASVVSMPARVDVSNSQQLLDAVRGEIAADQRKIVLDLSETEAIDSTALGAIVSLYKSLRVGEGDLVVCGASGGVTRVFSITRLDQVFSFYDDTDAAVAAVG